jgi:hypothetical protein
MFKAQIKKLIEVWDLESVIKGPDVFGECLVECLPEELVLNGQFNTRMFDSLIKLKSVFETGNVDIETLVDRAIEIITDPKNYK